MTHRHDLSMKSCPSIIGAGTAIIILMTMLVLPTPAQRASAAPVVPNVAADAIVPAEFRDNMSWSQEGGWHWVTLSYDGTQRFTGPGYDYSLGKPLPVATYVATLVRSLAATDSCAGCVKISNTEEGPPAIMGGASNPTLRDAYAHLDNGPRRMVESTSTAAPRWTKGAWFLNYSPVTRSFFSWTWVPDDGGFQGAKTTAELSTTVIPSLASLGQISLAQAAVPGSRVLPIAGNYRISQAYGCVPRNPGYASPSFCPAERPSFHDGVDFAASLGTPIVAAASGRVTFAGIDTSTASGNSMIVIALDGSNAGYETIYLHWKKSFVKAGDHVNAGQVIAEVGSVGYSTGPHLHFSVRVVTTNQTIDPLAWFTGSIRFVTSSSAGEPAYAGVMRWQSLIQRAARAHNVPAGLIAAIMAVESGGNPNAVSPAGALGLMQMMPDQLRRLGVPHAQWMDPASNIDAAARYLSETLGSGGTLQDAVARYFGSGCDVLGTCTQDYVTRVLTLYVYFANWIENGAAPTSTNPAPLAASPPPSFATPVPSSRTSGAPSNSAPSQPSTSPGVATTPAATPAPAPASSPQPTPTPATAPATPTPTEHAATPTATPESTASPTPTATPEPTASSTSTPAATSTPESTATATPSPSASPSTTDGSRSNQNSTPGSSSDRSSSAIPNPTPPPIIGPVLPGPLPIGSGANDPAATPAVTPAPAPGP